MENYLKSNFRKKKRYNIKRQLRVASVDHKIKFIPSIDKTQVNQALADFFSLHQKRMRQKGEKSSILSEEARNFFSQFTTIGIESGLVDISLLEKNGLSVGAAYNLFDNNKIYYFQSGFDSKYHHLSLGSVMITHLIEEGFKKKQVEFDFLSGDEAYKNSWKTGERAEFEIQLWKPNWKGHVGYSTQLIKSKIKKWLIQK